MANRTMVLQTALNAGNTSASWIIGRAWMSYLGRLDTNPLMTKAISSAVLSVVSSLVGSAAAKTRVRPKAVVDEFCIGLILRGPVVHFFHSFLDKVVFRRTNQNSKIVVIAKVLLDQLIFAPIFISLYFYLSGIMADMKLGDITRKIRRELFAVMKGNWSVWVPANIVGYGVIPLNLRVLFGSVIDIFWTAYLIAVVNRKKSKRSEEEKRQ